MQRHRRKKLTLSRESIANVAGAALHRTTLRCHETQDTFCFYQSCYGTFCDFTCFNTDALSCGYC